MSDQTPTRRWLEAEAELVAWLAQREGITEPAEAVRAIVGAALEGLVVVPADEPLYRLGRSLEAGEAALLVGFSNLVRHGVLVQVYPKEEE